MGKTTWIHGYLGIKKETTLKAIEMSWRQMVQYKMRRGKSWKLCLGNILKKPVPVTCLLALESAPCLSLFYCELQGSIPQVTLPCFFDYVFLDAFGQWQVLARCWRTEAGIKSEYPILFLFSQHLQQLPCSLSGFHVCDTTLAPGLRQSSLGSSSPRGPSSFLYLLDLTSPRLFLFVLLAVVRS